MSPSSIDVFASATLYLGPEQVLLRYRGAIHRAEVVATGWAGALAALQDLLDDHKPRGRVAVLLASHFAPLWLFPGAPARLSHEETRGWVAAQAAERFAELAANWRFAFSPAAPGDPILVSGIDAGHWAGLLHTLTLAGLGAVTVTPWPALALQRHAGRGTARLALAEKGRITLVSLERGAAVALDSARGEPGALADLVTRAALVDGLGSAPLHLVGCGVAGDWHGARVLANTMEAAVPSGHGTPDFLQTRPHPPLAAWLLLAAGLGLAALTGQRYATLTDQLAAASLQKIVAPAKLHTPRTAADIAVPTRPWASLLDRLETQRPKQVALLSLRGDALRGEAQISAEARSEADMLDWLKILRSEVGFNDVILTHHEILEEEGRHPVLFDLQLGWGNS